MSRLDPGPRKAGKAKAFYKEPRWIVLWVLTFIVLVLIAVLIFRIPKKTIEPAGDAASDQAVLGFLSKKDMSSAQARHCYPIQDELLYISLEQLVLEDYHGSQVYAMPVEFKRPAVYTKANMILCGDRDSARLVLINKDGLVFDTNLDGSFAGADFNGKNRWAVIDEVPETHPRVHLLDEHGQRIFTLSFDKSGSPLRVSFTPDGHYLDVLILNSSGSRLKTLIKRYSLESGSQTSQKAVESYEDLFAGLLHDRDGLPVIYSSTHLLRYDFAASQSLNELEFATIRGAFSHPGGISIVAGQEQDGSLSVYELKSSGEVAIGASNIGSVDRVMRFGDRIIWWSGNHMGSYHLNSSKPGDSGTLDGEILAVDNIGGGKLNVVTERGARIVQIP